MKQFYLVETTTKDGLVHQGVYFAPSKKGRRALLWLHGIGGTFYGSIPLYEAFVSECEKLGYGFAAFNTRGHDSIAGLRKIDKKSEKGYKHVNGGAGYEVFEESIHDIDAGIQFLVDQGFSEAIVIGYSTGANKACYYFGKKNHPKAAGVVLAGPISDRLDLDINKKKLKKNLIRMEKLVKAGRGDELIAFHQFPMTPKRFISLLKPNTSEDTFDYGDKKPRFTSFARITKPLLVVLSARDEYLDRPVEEVQRVFDAYAKSKQYRSIVLPEALHKFNGKEKEAVETIVGWIKEIQ